MQKDEIIEKKFMNDSSYATLPGEIAISMNKLDEMYSEEGGIDKLYKRKTESGVDFIQVLKEHMQFGSCEPAMVVNKDPLFIAVYSEDVDSVLILHFPSLFSNKYPLKEGVKLLSVNTYGKGIQDDVIHGPGSSHVWNSFWPIIAEFVSDDYKTIKEKKAMFPEDLWIEVYKRGREQLNVEDIIYRKGEPFKSCIVLKDDMRVKFKGEIKAK